MAFSLKVIANMTLGRDVSLVYADVVKLSRTSSLELKKLVYLYIMNNSKLQPDKAILAVNTFVQDSQHESAMVRALALRTMLCIRVEDILEYTLVPLKKAINVCTIVCASRQGRGMNMSSRLGLRLESVSRL